MGEERAGGDACPFALAPQFLVVWGCAGGDVLEARLEIGGGGKTSSPHRPRCVASVHGGSLDFGFPMSSYEKLGRAEGLRN